MFLNEIMEYSKIWDMHQFIIKNMHIYMVFLARIALWEQIWVKIGAYTALIKTSLLF